MKQQMICNACGTQYPEITPDLCPICTDDRQYLPESGQTWTTPIALAVTRTVEVKEINSQLYEFRIIPAFAIGQRALFMLSENGNILWDCIPLLNEAARDLITSKGGLKAIILSHPHYYSNMNQWANAFDCPVYIHKSDEQWVQQKDQHIHFWEGIELSLWDNIRIVNTGGHFPGSCILYVQSLAGKSTVLCGDTLYLAPSLRHIAISYSYPNHIPLPLKEVYRIKTLLEELDFDALYGAFRFQNLTGGAKEILENSMAHYRE